MMIGAARPHIFVRAMALGIRPTNHAFLIAGLVANRWKDRNDPILYFLPSPVWALLVADVEAEARETWQKSHSDEVPPKFVPDNFQRLRILTTEFVNAGSEDQDAIDALNAVQARRCEFHIERERLASGNATFSAPHLAHAKRKRNTAQVHGDVSKRQGAGSPACVREKASVK